MIEPSELVKEAMASYDSWTLTFTKPSSSVTLYAEDGKVREVIVVSYKDLGEALS